MQTVNKMWKYAQDTNLKLLSDFDADFWNEYKTNSDRYDALFRRMYHSFYYFLQEDDESIEEVTNNFIYDVYNHLLINAKKYSELYRINVVDDEHYDLTNNYDMTEVMNKTASQDIGQQQNNTTIQNGAVTNQHYVSPYDSGSVTIESENRIGAQANTSNDTLGARHDGSAENYTLTRKGNIGVQTATDMLEKHSKYWRAWDFYNYIFAEISRELLLV